MIGQHLFRVYSMLIKELVLDRETLAIRNQSMAEAFHKIPPQHYVRRALLRTVAKLPISNSKQPNVHRILLIRPDHLGDVLLTTPAIIALRHALPDVELHALVGPWSAQVMANYPEIDSTITLPFPGFDRSGNKSLQSPYQLALRTANQLRQVKYQTAIIFRPDHWWGAMITYLAGIRERIGYNITDTEPFLTDAITHQHQHAVLQNLRLVEKWTGIVNQQDIEYRFSIQETDRAYIQGYLQEWGIDDNQAIMCIHAGSGTWVKRWTPERWATVADTLSDQLNVIPIFTGGDHEMPLVQSIVQHMSNPACVMVGDTQISQLGALFARAKVVIGPDSGPLHLAAALDTPTVTLFGPADPVEFGAWGSNDKHVILSSNISCRPCRVLDWGNDDPDYHPCMRDITIGQVLEASRRVATR